MYFVPGSLVRSLLRVPSSVKSAFVLAYLFSRALIYFMEVILGEDVEASIKVVDPSFSVSLANLNSLFNILVLLIICMRLFERHCDFLDCSIIK